MGGVRGRTGGGRSSPEGGAGGGGRGRAGGGFQEITTCGEGGMGVHGRFLPRLVWDY